MNYEDAWKELRERLAKAAVEIEGLPFQERLVGKLDGVNLAAAYMDEFQKILDLSPRQQGVGQKKRASRRETDKRTVHARGVDEEGFEFEVVRYERAGKWWIEWLDGESRCVTLNEAVEAAHEALLGLPGGHKFDVKWLARNGEDRVVDE